METFEVRRDLKISREEALKRVKDIEGIPKYWKGTKELIIKRKDLDKVYAKVKFAFPGSSYYDAIITILDNGLRIEYPKSTFFNGVQENIVTEKELVTKWSINLSLLGLPMKGWILKHFKDGATHALMRINGEL